MSEKRSLLGRIFGFLWGTVVAIYRLMVVLVIVAVVFAVWVGFRGGTPPVVEDNVALVLWPTGALVESSDRDPGTAFIEDLAGEMPSQTLLRDLIEALDAASGDPRIGVVVLKLDDLGSAGLAQMQELAAAMARFKESGKPIYAHSPGFDQLGYFAASHASEVLLDPQGVLLLEGFSVYTNYFKEGLDKLGVDINLFRVGEYKSAVEPFTRNDMSEEAKLANIEWLGDLWGQYLKGVSSARALPEGEPTAYIDAFATRLESAQGDAAAVALEAGLVTAVATLDEFRSRVAESVGFDDEHGSFRQIHHADYLQATRSESASLQPNDKVALVVVQGEIVDGNGDAGQAGGEQISQLLIDARRDEDVKAVVLRVDSPGGSVWASEQIRREVRALREAGKPVVASMASVAASGGYWVSMDSDQIWAHDTTITGSIGIFGLIPTIDKPLAKLGIYTDGVGTTPLAGGFRIDRPLSEPVKAIVQSLVERGYRDFIEGVAQARGLELAAVDQLARGRVWSGEDALELGLVDEIGGLNEAADAAAALAQLEEGSWKLGEMAPEADFPLQMLSRFFGTAGIRIDLGRLPGGMEARLLEWLEVTDVARQLSVFNDPRGVYAYCFCQPGVAQGVPH